MAYGPMPTGGGGKGRERLKECAGARCTLPPTKRLGTVVACLVCGRPWRRVYRPWPNLPLRTPVTWVLTGRRPDG